MITDNSKLFIRTILTVIDKECIPKDKKFSSQGKRNKLGRQIFKKLNMVYHNSFMDTMSKYPTNIDSSNIRNIIISSTNNMDGISDNLKRQFETLYTDDMLTHLITSGIVIDDLDINSIYDIFKKRVDLVYNDAVGNK